MLLFLPNGSDTLFQLFTFCSLRYKNNKKFSTFNHVRYKSLSIKCFNLARSTQRLRYNTLQVYRADIQTSSDYIPAQLTPCGYKSFMHDVVAEVTDIE